VMKFLRPGSITGRTMIVLLVGLTLSHILSMLFLASERHDTIAQTEESLSRERVAVAAGCWTGRRPRNAPSWPAC